MPIMSDVCAAIFDAPREKSRGATLRWLERNCAALDVVQLDQGCALGKL
jgi:hypothetical protein